MTDPWRFKDDKPDEWEQMTPQEKSDWHHEKRAFEQVQRQYETDNTTLESGLQRFVRRFQRKAQRKHRKLKANSFWRDD